MNLTLVELLDAVAKHRDVHAMAVKSMPPIVSYMGADNGSILLLSGDRVVHKVLANRETFTDVSEHKVRTVLNEGLAGWVLRHRQGGLASETALDERWVSMGDESIASALVVPMISRGTVIGLLSFHHAERGHFRERHLARAAELAAAVAVQFDIALMTESSVAALTTLCQSANNPSVVVDWEGQIKVVNVAMQALDIAWEGVTFGQTLLPRELGVSAVHACEWSGVRQLVSLPYGALATPFRGAGVWIQLTPSP